MNHNKIKEVDATNILEANQWIQQSKKCIGWSLGYSGRFVNINDETIRKAIEQQAEFNSKQGLTIDPNQGEGDELDINEAGEEVENSEGNQDKTESKDYTEEKKDKEIEKLEGQIKTLLSEDFCSFLSWQG